MQPSKYVVVVADRGGRLERTARDLADGVRVLVVYDGASANDLLGRGFPVALVFVEDATGANAQLATTLMQRYPALPIVWAPPESAAVAGADADGARSEALRPDYDLDDLKACIVRLVPDICPAKIVEDLVARFSSALGHGFGIRCEVESVALSCAQHLPGQLNVLARLYGDTLTGGVVLGGSRDQFERVHRRMLPGDSGRGVEDLEDVAGEMLNQVVGRYKAYLLRFDKSVEFGLPTALFGNEPVLARKARCPSIVVSLDGDERFALEWWLDSTHGQPLWQELHAVEEADAGAVSFLSADD